MDYILMYFVEISLSVCWLQSRMMKKTGRENKTAVVVGTVTDDLRLLKVPKLKVAKNYLAKILDTCS